MPSSTPQAIGLVHRDLFLGTSKDLGEPGKSYKLKLTASQEMTEEEEASQSSSYPNSK